MTVFTDTQVEQAFASSSTSVNAFIEEGLFGAEMVKLAEQYNIPKQNLESFFLLCRNALIGLVTPSTFSEELRLLGIPATTIPPLATNFHERVIRAASEFVPPQEDSVPVADSGAETFEKPGVEQRMLPEGHHETQEVVATPKKVVPTPSEGRVTPVQKPVHAPQPIHPRTMASDVEAMQGGGKPVISKPVAAPHPIAPPRPAPPPTVTAVQEDLKKYGVDPYREPIQ